MRKLVDGERLGGTISGQVVVLHLLEPSHFFLDDPIPYCPLVINIAKWKIITLL